MSWKLYEIDAVLRDAIEAAESVIDMETGEISEDWAAFLSDVQMERDAKALGVAAYVRECSAEADAIEAERARLDKRARAVANKADRMKRYLSMFVQPGEKLKSASVSIGWRKSTSVEVEAPVESLPAEYVRVVPETRAPDKRAIGDALKAGQKIEGCKLVDKQNIQIK